MFSWPLVRRSTCDLWQHRAQVAEKHLARIDRRYGEVSAQNAQLILELKAAREAYAELAVMAMKRGSGRD